MKVNGPGRWKKLARKKFLIAGIACMTYTDILQALIGEPLSSGFSTDGTLISASAV